MRRKILLFFILSQFLLMAILGAKGNIDWSTVKIITEDLPPLGYVDKKDSRLKGETVYKVQKAMKYLGITNSIQVYPWARAFMMALNEPNIFIFNLARTPERENQFKWVFQTKIKKTGIFALRNQNTIKIRQLEDAKNYKIIVLNQNIAHLTLLKKGFDQAQYFYPVKDEDQLITLLYMGRADIWVRTYLDEHDLDNKILELGKDPRQFIKIFDINEMKINLYLAASLKTSDDKILQFKQAMEKTQ